VHTKCWSDNLKGRGHSEDLDIDVKIILERIIGKYGGSCGLDTYGSGQGRVVDSCEHGNEPEPFYSTKSKDLLGLLCDY
jgi:hypothetical protein